jgi:hypothetical protein
MNSRSKPNSQIVLAIVLGIGFVSLSFVGWWAWQAWSFLNPKPDTVVYDPGAPLHSNPRARIGNYNSDEPVDIDWRSNDGKARLRLRIPGEFVSSVYGTGRGVPRGLESSNQAITNGVHYILIYTWISGDQLQTVASLKRVRAMNAPGSKSIEIPGTQLMITLEGVHSTKSFEAWRTDGSARSLIEYQLTASERAIRRMPDLYGLERYRSQACGEWLPDGWEKYPLMPEEEPRPDCRDLGNRPEDWLSPAEVEDGVHFECYIVSPSDRPTCRYSYAQYEGWRLSYSFARDHLPHWQNVRTTMRNLFRRFQAEADKHAQTITTGEAIP